MFVKWRTVVFQGQEYRTKGLWAYRGAVEKAGKGGGRQDFLQARLWNAVILIIWDDCAPLCANFGKDNADPNKAVRLAENHLLFLPFFLLL